MRSCVSDFYVEKHKKVFGVSQAQCTILRLSPVGGLGTVNGNVIVPVCSSSKSNTNMDAFGHI